MTYLNANYTSLSADEKVGAVWAKRDDRNTFKYREFGDSWLRTNEKISDENILLTDSTHLLIFNRVIQQIVLKIDLNGFGAQKRASFYKLPFLYKAAWVPISVL